MTTTELEELRKMGVRAVIKKYFHRIGKTPEEGGITRETYDRILKEVSPQLPSRTGEVLPGLTRESDNRGSTELGRDEITQSPGPYTPPEPTTAASAGTHSDPLKGRSQKARILALLQDHEPHTTNEIMKKCYLIEDQKAGYCNHKARIDELREEGWQIPFGKRVKGGLFSYVLRGKQSTRYFAVKEK